MLSDEQIDKELREAIQRAAQVEPKISQMIKVSEVLKKPVGNFFNLKVQQKRSNTR